MNNEECDRVPSQGERPEESRVWERYWEAVRRRGLSRGRRNGMNFIACDSFDG
jgi:hypothetical protein